MIRPKGGTIYEDQDISGIRRTISMDTHPSDWENQDQLSTHNSDEASPSTFWSKTRNKLIVVIVLAVIALLIIAALTSGILGGTRLGNDKGDIQLSQLSYQGLASNNSLVYPDPGNHYILVNVTVTNHKTTSLSFSTGYFNLTTSDGLRYHTKAIPYYPLGYVELFGGENVTIQLTFEISISANPTILEFYTPTDNANILF